MSVVRTGKKTALAFSLVFGVALLVLVCRWSVDGSMTAMLPPASRELSQDAQRVLDSSVSRAMLLSIGPESGSDPKEARRVARELAATLASHSGVAWVELGPAPELERHVFDAYFPRRFQFMADDAALAHLVAQVPSRITDLERQLAGPAGPLVRTLAPEDPLTLFPSRLARIQERHSDVLVEGGQFMARDGHALLVVGLRDSPLDGTAQKALLDSLDGAFAELAPAAFTLERSGVNVFAADTEERIKGDVSRISAVSTVGMLLLFVWVFRSAWSLLLTLLPLAFGFALAAAGTLLCFGRLHALTLAFGASLLGAGVDYPVHLLNHLVSGATPEHSKGVISGIALGALTTVLGVGALAFSGSQLMLEVGVFSVLGLGGAAALTLGVLPWLAARLGVQAPQELARRLARSTDLAFRKPSWLAALAVLALLGSVGGLLGARWDTSLEALAPRSEAIANEDARVRKSFGGPDLAAFVIASGANEEAALQANDRVAAELERAQRDGLVRSFHSLHDLVWSTELQRRNYDLAKSPAFAEAVTSALEPRFDVHGFQPFFDALTNLEFRPLRLDDLRSSPLSHLLERFVVSRPEKTSILSYPDPVSPEAATELARRLGALPGVHWLEQRRLLDEAYVGLRQRVRWALVLGTAAVVLVVALHLRSLRATLATAAPALVAPVVALGVLALCGRSLNVFHLFAALVVVSMAVDFGIFTTQTLGRDEPSRSGTLLSIVMASATTCLSFGLLGISSIPVLSGIGWTVALGVAAATMMVPVSQWLHQLGRSKGDGP